MPLFFYFQYIVQKSHRFIFCRRKQKQLVFPFVHRVPPVHIRIINIIVNNLHLHIKIEAKKQENTKKFPPVSNNIHLFNIWMKAHWSQKQTQNRKWSWSCLWGGEERSCEFTLQKSWKSTNNHFTINRNCCCAYPK